jgi:hypothetical protein
VLTLDFSNVDSKEQVKLAVEGVKIAASLLLGFSIAFIAEPIKLYAVARHNKLALRAALYKEIVIFLDAVQMFIQQSRNGIQVSLEYSLPEKTFVFDHAMQDPMTFYTLEEAIQIQRVYADIKILLFLAQKPDTDSNKIHSATEKVLERASGILQDKRFKKSVLASATKELALHLRH